MTHLKFKVKGMHCRSCETLIEKSLQKLKGIKSVKADYETEIVKINFNPDKISLKAIFRIVGKKGYDCFSIKDKDPEFYSYSINFKSIGIVFSIMGLLVIGYFIFRLTDSISLPQISANMGYGLLFLVGLLTGFHCVSMCGGFVISYTTKHAEEGTKAHRSHLRYGVGKTLSYTLIGAAFGLLGSIITFTPLMRGIAGIIAGLFLVIFGLNMLNFIPFLRKIQFKTPASLSKFVGKESKKHKGPLIIGLLNGLMIACGPLQAIYIMAASTGSILEGAKLLFIFALGTLPVMLGFGFFTSFISNKATHKILKASGVVVILLGLIMVNRGLALTGTGLDTNSLFTSTSIEGIRGNVVMKGGSQIIRMEVNRYGWEPDKFVLKKGVPVKWVINGREINGCNNAIQVPKLGLNFDIRPGEQIIEFTPTKEGLIPWSCWMGMIPGAFVVKENVDLTNQEEIQKELATIPEQPSGSCDGSCGNPGCGAARGGGCGCGGRR